MKFSLRLDPVKFGKYFLFLLIGFVLVTAFYSNQFFSIENLIILKESTKNYYLSYPHFTKVIFSTVYILCVMVFIPVATLLTILSGLIFGLVEGTILSLLSASIGATISLYFVRSFFYPYFLNYQSKRFQKFSDSFKAYGSTYLFAARMAPIFPFFLVNIFMALMPIKILQFFLVSFLGMAPMTFIFVYMGTVLGQIDSYKDILTLNLIVTLSLIGCIPFLFKLIFNRCFSQRKNT